MNDDETFVRLLYGETVRGLSNDLAILDSIRARAGTLFGAALVATSFLSAKQGEMVELRPFGVAAMCFFAAAAARSVVTLMPRNLRFAVEEKEIDELLKKASASADVPGGSSAYLDITQRLRAATEDRNKHARWLMFAAIKILPLLVALELVCWVIELTTFNVALERFMLSGLIIAWSLAAFVPWSRKGGTPARSARPDSD
jgi:hypothetical protein